MSWQTQGATEPLVLAALRGTFPLIDVRAPVEFAQGAFPHAINLPILSDNERHRVGLTYKHSGRDAAVALGHKLVSGEVKAERLSAWIKVVEGNAQATLCCWRGGMRSQIASKWLSDSGHDCPVVPGGFKAIRRAGIELFERAATAAEWVIVGGMTGVGKTHALVDIEGAVDLEGAANHRGSSFGAQATPQPSQVSFENQLAVAFARHDHDRIIVEDEGRTIGRLAIPETLFGRMRTSSLVLIEATLSERIANIVADYIDGPLSAGDTAAQLEQRYREALGRLKKRLGDQRWREIDGLIARGFELGDHEPWIEAVLVDYYDPTYSFQLEKKKERIIFRGNRAAVVDYLAHATGS